MAQFNVIMLGDIVGKPGRLALKKVMAQLRKDYNPDLVIANAENLSHGFGVSEKTLQEMQDAGVDFFTSGNHIYKRDKEIDRIFQKFPLIRPENLEGAKLGDSYRLVEVGVYRVLIINLIGQLFFKEKNTNQYKALDKILEETAGLKPQVTIVDFHAEATSEKKSLGFYADGRVSLFAGTHTHIQTADAEILPKGTGYITDLGMVGVKHSSLGVDFENIIKMGLTEEKFPKVIREQGRCTINGIFAKINVETGKTTKIKLIREEVEV